MKIQDCIYKDICDNDCGISCLRYLEMKYMLDNSNIPKSMQRITKLIPDDCDYNAFVKLADIQQSVGDFVDSGSNLYIYSNMCGNGKTTWSLKIMLQYFDSVWAGNAFTKRGLFLNVPTFLYECKNAITNPTKEFNNLKALIPTVDLLILDDIACTDLSKFDYSTLLVYINSRVLNKKSIIYTSNVKPEDLYDIVGQRIASRICSKDTIKVEFKGGDNR